MTHSHKYNIENWTDYYDDKLDETTRIEMTQHLADCNKCLEYYTDCTEANIFPAPLEMKKGVMRRLQKTSNTKQIMIAYTTAACIAMGFYSFGLIDKTIDYAPKGIEKTFNAVDVISENVTQVTNKIIWRDFNEKEK